MVSKEVSGRKRKRVTEFAQRAIADLRAQLDKELVAAKERHEKDLAAVRADFEHSAVTAKATFDRELANRDARITQLENSLNAVVRDKNSYSEQAQIRQAERKCFDAPLQLQELEGIREMVNQHADGGRGRLETTWTVLRKFGYAEDLRSTEAFLSPKFDIPPDCSVELSPPGYQFFTDIFETFDKDQDGALNPSELEEVFGTSPGNPWTSQGFPDTTLSDDTGSVTLQGWLAQWSMTTLLDHKTALAYLAYLGYPDEPRTSALQITRA
ncbi:EF hand associated-domain-containing protein [Lentinula guzmanii]|uniref:EF hand associated-domain-containing protein n=1 Tax=Lentinula guzmanii TaxID=2804957 RepID=A0AA38JE94_9AGAR|nr:EF hand associated-domain-containing protein [Lentinula guzmanii]